MVYLIILRQHSRINVNFKSIIYMLRAAILLKLEIRAFGCLENINSIIVLRD
jgi:hypothetical protein